MLHTMTIKYWALRAVEKAALKAAAEAKQRANLLAYGAAPSRAAPTSRRG